MFNLITLQQEIIKITVIGGGLRASARGPARRFSFLLMCIVSLRSFFSRTQVVESSCYVVDGQVRGSQDSGRRDAQTNAVSDGEVGDQSRYSVLSLLVHRGGMRTLAVELPAFLELAAGSMVKCASDEEESESGEAMFCSEAEAGAEVKAGGEAEASGTGGAVDARFKADRVNAAFMGLAQGPGWAAVAGDAVGCLGGEATSQGAGVERRRWR